MLEADNTTIQLISWNHLNYFQSNFFVFLAFLIPPNNQMTKKQKLYKNINALLRKESDNTLNLAFYKIIF